MKTFLYLLFFVALSSLAYADFSNTTTGIDIFDVVGSGSITEGLTEVNISIGAGQADIGNYSFADSEEEIGIY